MTMKKSDRTSKKRKYTTPGGVVKTAYSKKKNVKLKCSGCGKELSGIPTSLRGKSKSEKVPNRPYAGIYCSNCMRSKIKEDIRSKEVLK
ncbi:MAG: 50S ribosomal protein L34e [Nanoarchaeota archaeon]|nr:50S ribosomal protein L34e [Nanoarchaeota archaeon]